QLILKGNASNIGEDQSGPLEGADLADLARGSAGALDPFIGPVDMPAGPGSSATSTDREVYYVAVSSNAQMPEELLQYQIENNPPNPFVRLEPVNSVRRIAEDRVNFFGGSGVAETPVVPVLLDPAESVVPYHLGDVTLFVTRNGGLAPQTVSTLQTVDPFTGARETTAGSFPEPIADVAMRGDGNLFAFTRGPNNFNGAIDDASVGTYVQIDTGDASTTQFNDDGVETYVEDPTNAGTAERAPAGANNDGVGIVWNAMAYQLDTNRRFRNGFVAGSRRNTFGNNNPDDPARHGIEFTENVLFQFDTQTGDVLNSPRSAQDRSNNAELLGAGTQKIEVGEILTYTRFVPQFPQAGDTFTISINDASIRYTSAQGTVQEVVAGLAAEWASAALTIPEFAAYEVLNSTIGGFFGGIATELRVRLTDPGAAFFNITTSTRDGGGSFGFFGEQLVVEGGGPGGDVTGMDFVDGQLYAVTDRGGLYRVDLFPQFNFSTPFFFFTNNLATYVPGSAIDLMTADNGAPISFSGLTAGPEEVENGRYAEMLFGISDTGELYAFNTDGELQNIFVNDQSSVSTNIFSANGLAFSTLDRNLWTVTDNRGDDEGHGLNGPGSSYIPNDRSRLEQRGGQSFFFGNDRATNEGGNQSYSNTPFVRDYNFAGGAYGSLVSNPFSLAGYSEDDRPVLYFNYFLDTENTNYDPTTSPITPTRDTFRVYASGDDGEWTLLATNDTFQDSERQDEFDIGQNDFFCVYPAFSTEPCVQKLFDNTGWRQVRIPLSRFAGEDNLRLRFDVSTAGSMNVGDTFTVGSELRAIEGAALRDGETVRLTNGYTLEFDLGYTLVAPNGAAIDDGDSFTIDNGSNPPTTFVFDDDNTFATDLSAVPGIQLDDGDTFRLNVDGETHSLEMDSGYTLLVPAGGGDAGNGGVADGDTFVMDNVVFEFDSDGAFVGGNAIINVIVDTGIQIPSAGGASGGLTDGEQLIINNGLGGPDVVFEFDNDGRWSSVSRPVDLTNIELRVPIAGAGFGGIADGDSFKVNDGVGGSDVTFEFDLDNNVGVGNRVIPITSTSTQDDVANAIVVALQASGIGLKPVNQGCGVVRMGLFRQTVDTTDSPALQRRTIDATQDEIADRLTDTILNSGSGLVPFNAGNGLVRMSSTRHIVSVANAPNLTVQEVAGSQDEVADLIVDIVPKTTLGFVPINLGGGRVYLGRQVTVLDTSGSATLAQSGAPGVNDANARPVLFTPRDTAGEIAQSIANTVNQAPAITTAVANGDVVELPDGVTFSPNGTAFMPTGVTAVPFSAGDSPTTVGGSIVDAINRAFAPARLTADLTAESNDRLATAVDAGLPGGPAVFQASGFIGDNTDLEFRRGVDVDYVRLDLDAGDRMVIDASSTGFTISPALRLFDANGQELASSLQTTTFTFFAGFTSTFTTNIPTIDFTAVTSGTYYLGVSGSGNLDYEPDFDGSADVTLLVPAVGGGVGGLTDGESFTIDEGTGGVPILFEFDSNGQVAPGAISISLTDVVLSVPDQGVNPGGIQDGDTFTINDNRGSGDVVFEFDSDGIISPDNNRIFVFPGDTANTVAFRIQSALFNANMGLSPTVLGNSSLRLGTKNHSVDINGTPSMSQSLLPRTQQEIATFLGDAIRNARIGLKPTLTLGAVDLDVQAHTIDVSLAPNLQRIQPAATGAYDLRIDVNDMTPFDLERVGHRVNLLEVDSVTQSGLPTSFVSGQPGTVDTDNTAISVDAGMSRAEVAQAVATAIGQSTAGYLQQIVAVGGANISDGEIFSISDGSTAVNFEFENGYSLQLPDPQADPTAFLDGEYFTIDTDGLLALYEFDDDGTVITGNAQIRVNDILLTLPFGTVNLGGVNDGDTFAVDQGLGAPATVFEFDTDGITTSGNEVISVAAGDAQNVVANAMVQALITADLGLSPRNLGQGQVQLGITNQVIDIAGTPGMSRRTILLSRDEIADKIVAAVRASGASLTPTNLGSGLVHIGGIEGVHTVDVTPALGLTLIGEPGASDPTAIVIPVFPSSAVSATQVSELIQSAIDTARVTRGLNVSVVLADARRINLIGSTVITDFAQAPSLPINDAGGTVKVYDNIVRVIGNDVISPGPLGLEASLAGDDPFGAFEISGPPNVTDYPGALRGMDNANEGVYLDDIVIGFAERGEVVTGANNNPVFVPNEELLNAELPVGTTPHTEIHVGPYQLEVREAEWFAAIDPVGVTPLISFDTNDRLTEQTSLHVPLGNSIVEGQTFTLADGLDTVTFEFSDLAINDGVAPGNVVIGYRASDSQVVIARRIRDAVNSPLVQSLLEVTASLSDGTTSGSGSTSARVDFSGNATLNFTGVTASRNVTVDEPNDVLSEAVPTGIGTDDVTEFVGSGSIGDNPNLPFAGSDVDLFEMFLNAGQTAIIDIDAWQVGSTLDPILSVFDADGNLLTLNDDFDFLDSFIDFTATTTDTYYVGVSSFANFFYNPLVEGSGFGFSTGTYDLKINTSGAGFRIEEFDFKGDRNIERDQGQILIQSNTVSNALNAGILADAGARDGDGNNPHVGPSRVTREVNTAGLTTGVTVANNLIVRSGTTGIQFTGDPSNPGEQVAAVPFGRILNNTVVGRGAVGVGIQVGENASPTLLNNVVANLNTGISVDASSQSTIIGGTLYQGNTTNTAGVGLGSFPVVLDPADPLFVNAGTSNFYLAPTSRAIDSSINSLQDRQEMVAVKSPLGMGLSPILAPDLDSIGQLRVDDPDVDTPPGQGANVFKDRGALDRADFVGPSAILVVPRDNDAQNRDQDPRDTYVELTNEILTNFSIHLVDGIEPNDPRDGTGADDSTVRGSRVSVFRDEEKLIQGIDYSFQYDATNNIIRLTPLAGIWEVDKVYEIELSNGQGFVISAPVGTAVTDGDSFDVLDAFGNTVTFEYDSGYSLQVPQTLTLQLPDAGGTAIADGETFVISDGTTTEIFEFDNNGAVIEDNIIIEFSAADSANDLATKMVDAIDATSLGLSPVNIQNFLGRAVHLGSTADHTLDTTSTTLGQAGQAGGIEDGQTFTIDDGSKVVTFEFVDRSTTSTVNQLIPFSLSQTHEQIADAMVDAIQSARVGLNPTHEPNSDGLVHLGGTPQHIVNLTDADGLTSTVLTVSGLPGVRTAWGIKIPTIAGKPDTDTILDGETFSLTNNGTNVTVTYELDDDG
ncbi:MAG: hypothetical protein ACC628_10600, partial [Pirellulaceae bacterium]